MSTTPLATTVGSPAERAEDLLREMTIDEKAMQLSAWMPIGLIGHDGPIESQLQKQLGLGIGHVSGLGLFGHKSPATTASTVNRIQRHLVENTRLGIPAIFHNEALNGVLSPDFTVFPTAIGLAATWNPDRVQEMAD